MNVADRDTAIRIHRSNIGWVLVPYIVSIFLESIPGYIIVSIGIAIYFFASRKKLAVSDFPSNYKKRSTYLYLLFTLSLLLVMVQIIF